MLTVGHQPIYLSATTIAECTICGKPACHSVNVNMNAAYNTPSKFEWRCADHGLKLNFNQGGK